MTQENRKPDILICMSDQHGADYLGWCNKILDTPVLDALKNEGVLFKNAYTPCPLCVPARMSFMSSLLPEHTGVYDNTFTLSDTIPCFTHYLVEAGYETVLAGRMHFIGNDQRHGFTRRIAPDMTPVGWAKPFKKIVSERGKTVRAFSSGGATDLAGAGASIVNEYDSMVTKNVLEYLSQEHEKPQFILVGTFGPHFPYIADETLYRKYLDRAALPDMFSPEDVPAQVLEHPVLSQRVKDGTVTPEVARACLAAYFANIEEMDTRIGQVREAFENYTARSGRGKVFGYISDHGDMAGERRIYGKQTYYDKSARIPMLFTGDGIAKDTVATEPVSLLDIGPTVLELAGAQQMEGADGRSQAALMSGRLQESDERMIVSQMMDEVQGRLHASVMLRRGSYKFTYYHHCEDKMTLVDMEKDQLEKENLTGRLPEVRDAFLQYVNENIDFDRMEADYLRSHRAADLFRKYELATGINDEERWKDNSEESKGNLVITAADRIELAQGW